MIRLVPNVAFNTQEAKDITDEMHRRHRDGAGEVAEYAKDDLVDTLSVPVSKDGKATVRSEPGEPPRKEEGKLQQSVKAEVTDGQATIEVTVSAGGPDAPYAELLEYGGISNWGYVKARPFFGVVQWRVRNQIPSLMGHYL